METVSLVHADFYVSPAGNDTWSGKLADPSPKGDDGPFSSIERARDAVRELKNSQNRDIIVLLRDGTYRLSQSVVFGLEDSAPKGCSITYAAYPGDRPTFSAGVKVVGWREMGHSHPREMNSYTQRKVWMAEIPEGMELFHTLYQGERRLPRARSEGFIPGGETLPWDFLYENDTEPFWNLSFPEGAMKKWDNLQDVEIVIRPNSPFMMNILPLASVDEKAKTATTTAPGGYPLRPLRVSRGEKTCWVENILEALNQPGEWVVNTKTRKIYYWPVDDTPGEDIYAPCLTELFRVDGKIDYDGPTDSPVTGINFRGITFCHSDRGVVTKDDIAIQHDWEMIDKGDSLLRLRGAEDCSVSACRFTSGGGSAIRFDLHCKNNSAIGNEISHLGGGGINLIGYGPGVKDVNKKNRVSNNHIHHCGELRWDAHGIVMWQSGENRIDHNYIHHMPRKGILVSGVRPWFFDPSRGIVRECAGSIRWPEIKNPEKVKDVAHRIRWDADISILDWPEILPYLHARNNIVEYNELYRVSEVFGDGASINLTGAGDGNIIRRNYLHHNFNPMFHGAIRIDDHQNETTIEENVIFQTNSTGLCVKHRNYWINNIVCDVAPANLKGLAEGLSEDDYYGRRWFVGYIDTVSQRIIKGCKITHNIFFHPGGSQQFYFGDSEALDYVRRRRGGNTKDILKDKGLDIFDFMGRIDNLTIDSNVYFNNGSPDKPTVALEKLNSIGKEKSGVYADPLFEDWENGDFRLRQDSPARALGIKSLDVREMGLTPGFPMPQYL